MFDITRKFAVHIEGRGDLRVTPADHVASGGEGHVYRPGVASLALKVWDDPSRALSGRMAEKIKLLSALKDPRLVAPEALARDANGNIIGYVMPWVTGWDLPVAFTNDWRAAQGFGDVDAMAFANQMRAVTLLVHQHDIIMGDANELNILGAGRDPRYIDLDPWLPPGYRGDKIMPTIQDWHAPLFTKGADWFAWGVVTFQLLTGIHPYRGTHPDFKRGDMEGRMKANASVFDPKVKLNVAVRPVALIPKHLRAWYEDAFQRGARNVPPEVTMSAPVLPKVTAAITTTGKLNVSEAFRLPAAFVRSIAPDLILLADGTILALPDGRLVGRGPAASYMRLPAGGALAAILDDGKVHFSVVRPGTAATNLTSAAIAATALWSAADRLFAIVPDGILELSAQDLRARFLLLPGQRWALNPNATVFGDGAAVFDALGAKYLVVPQSGKPVAVIRCRELDGMKPVAILARGRVAVMTFIDKIGAYRRATFMLGTDLLSYTATVEPADDGSLTDVILDNGLVLWITANGDLGMSAGATFPLSGASGGRLIAGPSGVFCAVGGRAFRLSIS